MVGVGLFCIIVSECKGGEYIRHLQIFCKEFSTIMSKILTRINQFAESQGLSMREIERSIGATNGVISGAIKNNREIGSDKVENFLHTYSNVSAEWLLRGEGEMFKKEIVSESEVVMQLINKIAQLSEENGRLKTLLESKGGIAPSAEDSLSASAV